MDLDHSKLVVIDRFASQVEADLARSALESAGIDAMIQADRAGGMRDHLAWSGLGFKILVREEDADTAHELLHPPYRVPKGKLVVAQSCVTAEDAEALLAALQAAGIGATIQPATVASPSPPPSLSLAGPLFQVLVSEKEEVAAREVLSQLQ